MHVAMLYYQHMKDIEFNNVCVYSTRNTIQLASMNFVGLNLL